MIPCYSLFLEVEIPDPSLNYFVLNQHELDNTEKLLAPNISAQRSANTREIGEPLPVEVLSHKVWPWNQLTDDIADFPPEGATAVSPHDYFSGVHPDPTWGILNYEDTETPVAYDIENNRFLIYNYLFIGEEREIQIEVAQREGPGWVPNVFFQKTCEADTYHEILIAIPDDVGLSEMIFRPTFYSSYYDEIISNNFYINLPQQDCVSGLNTFVLGKSCLDGTIDLLEGYGAAKPNYAWIDLITDTTDINIDRGFDMNQGVVGTPLAGVMSANITDPFLDALNTSKVAIGQRCRLRAGTEIVFQGVVNVLRSDYNAVDVPNLYLESVDALGLLNAQMVSERPYENYKTRMSAAVNKVNLPYIIADSTTELNPTEDAMSGLDLLIETQDSEGSICWIDRFGTFYSTNRYWADEALSPVLKNSRFGEFPRFTFTNAPKMEQEVGVNGPVQEVCLSAYRQASDTREVINGITFYNYTEEEEEGRDENGDPIMEKVIVRDTHTFESANSRRLYGDAGVRLTTYLPENELVSYADFIFANYDSPKTKVETIQFPLDKWKDLSVPDTTTIDIGDSLYIRIDDEFSGQVLQHANQRVARIRHNITPTEWLCELDLL